MKCDFCGFEWFPRIKNPLCCPSCKKRLDRRCFSCGSPCSGRQCRSCFVKKGVPESKRESIRRYHKRF